jgi:hypothetical protein
VERDKDMEKIQGQQKPDKALKQAIAAARRSSQGVQRAQGIMVAASLATTMMGWAVFAHEGAQPVNTAQQEASTLVPASAQQSTQEAIATTSSTSSTSSALSASSTTPQSTTSAASATLQTAPTTAAATPVSTPQNSAVGSAPQAIVRTRSSQ